MVLRVPQVPALLGHITVIMHTVSDILVCRTSTRSAESASWDSSRPGSQHPFGDPHDLGGFGSLFGTMGGDFGNLFKQPPRPNKSRKDLLAEGLSRIYLSHLLYFHDFCSLFVHLFYHLSLVIPVR